MHEKGKHHNIVSTENCLIVDEDYRKILLNTLNYFTQKNIKHYNKFSKEGTLRHLVIRKASYTGEILVNLVTTSQDNIDTNEYKDIDFEKVSTLMKDKHIYDTRNFLDEGFLKGLGFKITLLGRD